jgi:hypothetical protein
MENLIIWPFSDSYIDSSTRKAPSYVQVYLCPMRQIIFCWAVRLREKSQLMMVTYRDGEPVIINLGYPDYPVSNPILYFSNWFAFY